MWIATSVSARYNLQQDKPVQEKQGKKYNLKYKASDKIRSAARWCAGRRSATRCARMTKDILTKLGIGRFF